jgi:hypothetical protein
MHPYLTRMGVSEMVQQFFAPFFTSDEAGNLCFWYGKVYEHFGFGFHRVPVSADLWLAGNLNFSQVRLVIISGSALDGVSWLNKKGIYLSHTENLLFISTGAGLQTEHIRWINEHLDGKAFCLTYGKDLLGRLASVKMAAGLRRLPMEVYAEGTDEVSVSFRSRNFSFSQDNFSLHAFEKAAGFRFGIRCDQPKDHLTFFDGLKADAFLNF